MMAKKSPILPILKGKNLETSDLYLLNSEYTRRVTEVIFLLLKAVFGLKECLGEANENLGPERKGNNSGTPFI